MPRDDEIPDEDALVVIASAGEFWDRGYRIGVRVHKDASVAQENPEAFVAVVPDGVRREDALIPLQRLEHIAENGERTVLHQGVWVRRDHELVQVHPHLFREPGQEED